MNNASRILKSEDDEAQNMVKRRATNETNDLKVIAESIKNEQFNPFGTGEISAIRPL